MHNNNCRVCGFDLLSPPWGNDGRTPSWEICPCCGTEFGYDDCTIASIRKKRTEWLSSGQKWFNESKKQKEWSLGNQLLQIPKEYL